MNTIRMTFPAGEDYHARLDRAKKDEDLRKCRCWFDCRDGDVTVILDAQGIALEYGKKNARAGWAELISVTEVRDGLLLRLNNRRLLLLPAGADDDVLISAGILLGQRCKATFRSGRTRLRGVSPGRWLDYHTRAGQWFSFGRHFQRRVLVCLACLTLAAGTLLVLGPFLWNREVPREEAVSLTATYESFDADRRYRRSYGQLRGISLQFTELGLREVDGNCPLVTLEEQLRLVQPGETMKLLTHPESGELLCIETEDNVLLSYEDYVKYLHRRNIFYVVFGLFWYIAAGGAIWELKRT